MSHFVPLTPFQEQIVRDLLASGRFQSEDDVVGAALHLLLNQSAAHFRTAGAGEQRAAPTHRSLHGVFADIASNVSAEDIAEARDEMWGRFSDDAP